MKFKLVFEYDDERTEEWANQLHGSVEEYRKNSEILTRLTYRDLYSGSPNSGKMELQSFELIKD